ILRASFHVMHGATVTNYHIVSGARKVSTELPSQHARPRETVAHGCEPLSAGVPQTRKRPPAKTSPATFGVSSGNPENPVTDGGDMNAVRNPGRVAGLWYLLLVLGGPLRLIYIPNKLFVQGDAAATAANIAAHPWLFRFGMASDLLGAVVLIFLVLAFYRLFKGVDQQLAVLLVISGGVMPALLNFVNVVTDAGALMVAQGA